MPKPSEKRIDFPTLRLLVRFGVENHCYECIDQHACFTGEQPARCPIWASLPEVAFKDEKYIEMYHNLNFAVGMHCTCEGGSCPACRVWCEVTGAEIQPPDDPGAGPGEGCPACDIYHDFDLCEIDGFSNKVPPPAAPCCDNCDCGDECGNSIIGGLTCPEQDGGGPEPSPVILTLPTDCGDPPDCDGLMSWKARPRDTDGGESEGE